MSAHDVEALVEASVRTLDKAGDRLEPRQLRDLIANLYRYQTHFDCGETHERVGEILRRWRFLLRLPLRSHPDAHTFAALFAHIESSRMRCSLHEARAKDGQSGLYVFGDEGWVAWNAQEVIEVPGRLDFDIEENSGVYYRPRVLKVEVGSSLWRRLVASGSLKGLDAVAPVLLEPQQTAACVVAEAERQGEGELIAWWYAALPRVVEAIGSPLSLLRDDADARAILEVVERTRAFELRSDWDIVCSRRESTI